jgi:hypothetical protein
MRLAGLGLFFGVRPLRDASRGWWRAKAHRHWPTAIAGKPSSTPMDWFEWPAAAPKMSPLRWASARGVDGVSTRCWRVASLTASSLIDRTMRGMPHSTRT